MGTPSKINISKRALSQRWRLRIFSLSALSQKIERRDEEASMSEGKGPKR